MKRTMLIVVAILVLATASFAADSTTNTLQVTANITSSVDLSFNTVNADITRTTATTATKTVNLSGPSNLSQAFNVSLLATIYNTSTTTGTLKAQLASAPAAGLSYDVNGVGVTDTATSDVSTGLTFTKGTQATLANTVTVTATAAAAAGSPVNTINFTLTVN